MPARASGFKSPFGHAIEPGAVWCRGSEWRARLKDQRPCLGEVSNQLIEPGVELSDSGRLAEFGRSDVVDNLQQLLVDVNEMVTVLLARRRAVTGRHRDGNKFSVSGHN